MRPFFLLCISLLIISQNSYGEIYKWIDRNGNIQFTDKKPPEGMTAEQLKLKINSISNAHIPVAVSTVQVIIYSARWCPVCKRARRYFKQQGIAYKEYDIENSAKGRADYKRMRGRGVPIILVNKQRINGFSRTSFEKIYKG